jgi:hypothetical protein
MTLQGPIRPSWYVNYQTPCPNPDSLTTGASKELIQCCATGRLWTNKAVLGQPSEWVQILPYTRNNGTGGLDPLVGVQFINDAGNMSVGLPQGADDGYLNLFGMAQADSGGFRLSSEAPSSTVYIDSLKALRSSPVSFQGLAADYTIVSASTEYQIGSLVYVGLQTGKYRIRFNAVFSHNNNYEAAIGIRFANVVGNTYAVYASSSTGRGGGGGYANAYAEATFDLDATTFDQVQFMVYSNAANVTVSRYGLHQFASSGFPSSPEYATWRTVERVG